MKQVVCMKWRPLYPADYGTKPGKGIGNTSVFRFRVGAHPYILAPEFDEIYRNYRIEQTYISRTVSEMKFWPNDWCVLFKTYCASPMPKRWWKTSTLPEGARVVAFPGVPNPHEAVQGLWPVKKWYKKLYKHIKPVALDRGLLESVIESDEMTTDRCLPGVQLMGRTGRNGVADAKRGLCRNPLGAVNEARVGRK